MAAVTIKTDPLYEAAEKLFLFYKRNPIRFFTEYMDEPMSPKQIDFFKAAVTTKHTVAIWARQTGKSTTVAKIIFYWLIFSGGLFNQGGVWMKENILVFAPIQKQTQNLFYKVEALLKKDPIIWAMIEKCNSEIITTTDGNTVEFLSASPGSHIRSPTATRIVIDESQDVIDSKYYADILPMGSTTNPNIVESGTPMTKNHFHETVANPDVTVIKQVWHECPFLNKEYIMKRKRQIPESLFDQEYMCIFSESSSTPFPSDQVESVLKKYRWSKNHAGLMSRKEEIAKMFEEKAIFVMGVDLGKQKDSTVITVGRVDKLPYSIVHQEEIPLGMPYTHTAGRIKALYQYFEPAEFNIDYTGEKGVTDLLVQEGVPVYFDKENKRGAIVFNVESKTRMVTTMQVLIQQKKIRFPMNAEVLFYQMTQQQYEMTSNNKYKFFHPENSHDDYLWSTLLCFMNVDIEGSETQRGHTESAGANVWTSKDKPQQRRQAQSKEETKESVGNRLKSRSPKKRTKSLLI